MLRRLLVGLVLGLVVGGLVAAGFVQGLHVLTFGDGTGGALFAYATAAVTGVLTGLVAGKPIWASGAKIEAGLKAFFGALIAAGLMFALRQWGGVIPVLPTQFTPAEVDQVIQHAGSLPAMALPMLAAVLGGFFEIDNTGGDESDTKGSRKRVADGGAKAKSRVATPEEDVEEEASPIPAKRAKR
jgi:hypothetical protein